VHIELSTAVVAVDTKVTNASLSQNHRLQCVSCNAALTHVEIPRPIDAADLNSDSMSKLGYIHYQTEPNLSIFPKEI